MYSYNASVSYRGLPSIGPHRFAVSFISSVCPASSGRDLPLSVIRLCLGRNLLRLFPIAQNLLPFRIQNNIVGPFLLS